MVQWDIGAMPNADGAADESVSPQSGITSRCSQLIKAHHGAKGYWNLPDLLWHEETREFIAKQANLQLVFRRASIARSPKKAQRGRKCEAERPCRLLIYQQLELRRQVAKLAGRRPQVPP